MRVVVVIDHTQPQKTEVSLAAAALKHILRQKGHALLIVPQEAAFHYPRTHLKSLTCWPLFFKTGGAFMPELLHGRSLWRNFSPNLLHLINPGLLALNLIRQAKADSMAVLVSYHDSLATPWSREAQDHPLLRDTFPWTYGRRMLKLADRIVVPNESVLATCLQKGLRQTELWKPGVDTRLFSPTQKQWFWRESLSGGAPYNPLILYVGPFVPSAKLTWLRYICDVYPDVRLALVGDGPQHAFLREYFADKPVVFTGPLEGYDLARAYASADCLLIPGAEHVNEQVLLAAMASQIPVVVPRTPIAESHLQHGRTGLLFNPKDFLSMLDSVRIALEPQTGRAMGLAARKYAETQDKENRLQALFTHYTALLNANSARRWMKSQDTLIPESGV